MKKYDILIATHSESLNWLKYLPSPDQREYRIVVSNSNGRSSFPGADVVTNRENTGREAGHYLDYIIRHYHDLPETTVFIQADPWAHLCMGGLFNILLEIFYGKPEFRDPICYLGAQYEPGRGLPPPPQFGSLQNPEGGLGRGESRQPRADENRSPVLREGQRHPGAPERPLRAHPRNLC